MTIKKVMEISLEQGRKTLNFTLPKEKILDPQYFWRVHRSAIVNIERIKTIKRSFSNQSDHWL